MGARVCKSWKQIRQSERCKPLRIDFVEMATCGTVFPKGSDHRNGFGLDVTLDFIRRFGSAKLTGLHIDNDYTFTMTQPSNWNRLINGINVFPNLTWLMVVTDDGVHDWRVFAELPTTMLHIDSCTLTNEFNEQTGHAVQAMTCRCSTGLKACAS